MSDTELSKPPGSEPIVDRKAIEETWTNLRFQLWIRLPSTVGRLFAAFLLAVIPAELAALITTSSPPLACQMSLAWILYSVLFCIPIYRQLPGHAALSITPHEVYCKRAGTRKTLRVPIASIDLVTVKTLDSTEAIHYFIEFKENDRVHFSIHIAGDETLAIQLRDRIMYVLERMRKTEPSRDNDR